MDLCGPKIAKNEKKMYYFPKNSRFWPFLDPLTTPLKLKFFFNINTGFFEDFYIKILSIG